MKYSLFKVLLSLKVVKFDTKNVFKFFKFSGMNLGWKGTSLGPKMGTMSMGELTKFLPDGEPPQSLQEKTLPTPL